MHMPCANFIERKRFETWCDLERLQNFPFDLIPMIEYRFDDLEAGAFCNMEIFGGAETILKIDS